MRNLLEPFDLGLTAALRYSKVHSTS